MTVYGSLIIYVGALIEAAVGTASWPAIAL